MRRILLALLLASGVAQAQTSSAPTAPAPAASEQTVPAGAPIPNPHASKHRTLAERFAEANTSMDGRLTPEQARAKMPAVARNFAAIDTGNKGYVTLLDIQAYNRARRASRRAAKQAGQAPEAPAQ